jgi:hypothetical protein
MINPERNSKVKTAVSLCNKRKYLFRTGRNDLEKKNKVRSQEDFVDDFDSFDEAELETKYFERGNDLLDEQPQESQSEDYEMENSEEDSIEESKRQKSESENSYQIISIPRFQINSENPLTKMLNHLFILISIYGNVKREVLYDPILYTKRQLTQLTMILEIMQALRLITYHREIQVYCWNGKIHFKTFELYRLEHCNFKIANLALRVYYKIHQNKELSLFLIEDSEIREYGLTQLELVFNLFSLLRFIQKKPESHDYEVCIESRRNVKLEFTERFSKDYNKGKEEIDINLKFDFEEEMKIFGNKNDPEDDLQRLRKDPMHEKISYNVLEKDPFVSSFVFIQQQEDEQPEEPQQTFHRVLYSPLLSERQLRPFSPQRIEYDDTFSLEVQASLKEPDNQSLKEEIQMITDRSQIENSKLETQMKEINFKMTRVFNRIMLECYLIGVFFKKDIQNSFRYDSEEDGYKSLVSFVILTLSWFHLLREKGNPKVYKWTGRMRTVSKIHTSSSVGKLIRDCFEKMKQLGQFKLIDIVHDLPYSPIQTLQMIQVFCQLKLLKQNLLSDEWYLTLPSDGKIDIINFISPYMRRPFNITSAFE